MAAQRDPVDRVIDLIVAVPVSFAAAVRELVPLDTGRLERAVGRNLTLVSRYARRRAGFPSPEAPRGPKRRGAPAEVTSPASVGAQVEARASAGPATGDRHAAAGELPIDGYDQLSARQVVDRLPGLTGAELATVERYERSHRRRQTVLGRIGQLS